LVRHTETDFVWPVLSEFTAEGTLDSDRLEGKFLPARRHIAAAQFAVDHEGLAG
jgi:hypothetical protein